MAPGFSVFDCLADGVAKLVAIGYPADQVCGELMQIAIAVMAHEQGEAATREWLATMPYTLDEHLHNVALRKRMS